MTPTLTGHLLQSNDYPAASILLFMPLVAIAGGHSDAGFLTDLLGLALEVLLISRLLAARAQSGLALMVLVPMVLLDFASGALVDSISLPLIATALWRADRYGESGSGVARWIGPVMLGIACSIKPQSWLLAPFLLALVCIEAHERGVDWRRTGLHYTATAAAVFLAINVPFIVWGPGAWLSAVLEPFTPPVPPTAWAWRRWLTWRVGPGRSACSPWRADWRCWGRTSARTNGSNRCCPGLRCCRCCLRREGRPTTSNSSRSTYSSPSRACARPRSRGDRCVFRPSACSPPGWSRPSRPWRCGRRCKPPSSAAPSRAIDGR